MIHRATRIQHDLLHLDHVALTKAVLRLMIVMSDRFRMEALFVSWLTSRLLAQCMRKPYAIQRMHAGNETESSTTCTFIHDRGSFITSLPPWTGCK